MNFDGVVHNGQIILDVGDALPEGTAVRATVSPTDAAAEPNPDSAASPLGRVLLRYAGKAQGLPPDMAAQHDHYLHGAPKR